MKFYFSKIMLENDSETYDGTSITARTKTIDGICTYCISVLPPIKANISKTGPKKLKAAFTTLNRSQDSLHHLS